MITHVCQTKRSLPTVVALFNAISKRQTQNTAEGTASTGSKSAAAGTAKSASRHAFLDMLKTGVKPAAGGAKLGGASGSKDGGAGWNKADSGEVGCFCFELFT